MLRFFCPKYHILNANYPFALRRLPTVELCSPCSKVPWSSTAVNRRARDSSLAMTHTVSVLSVWGFRMHGKRFMGSEKCKFCENLRLITSTLGLRRVKRSHPFFPVAPQRPPRPLVSPRPGVRMLSSRRWRVSRQASPFLSLPHPSMCAFTR